MISIISYDKLWKTMKLKGFSQYKLINYCGISNSLIHRLKNNESVTTNTLDKLCQILDCKVEDIITYLPDKK